MGDDITIGVTEIVNNIEVNAQPNDQIVDISVTDNADNVTLNITPTVVEVNINKGSSFAQWGDLYGTLSDQTDLQNALNLKANLVGGKVPASELPSYVDDIIEVANYAALPATGEIGKIYVTLDNNKIYRWSGSVYIEIASNSAIWGAITGTLSSQTDLVNALNLRVPYTGATSNVNLGEYGLTSGFLGLDTTPTSTPTGIGTIYWDAANRTAALIDGDGDTTLQIGQEQRILVHNNTGSTLTDGQVVYVTGSTGNLPSVSLANASSETTSAATIGVVTESIAQGADGFITTSGIVNGLNTLAFNEGDLLWLGTTAGTFTATKPISPNHLVLIGYVIKKAGGNGSILVKIQNTQELEESSDVLFTSLTNKDFLVYESSTDLWKNKSLGTVLAGTSSQFVKGDGSLDSTAYVPTARTLTINGTAYDLTADRSWTIATHNPVGIGTSNGLSIDSNQQLSLALASTSTNGALSSTDWNTFNGKQNALTNPITGTGTTNYLSKFTGSGTLGNSLIFDNGTNVGVGTTSPSQKLDVQGNISMIGTSIYKDGATSVMLVGRDADFYGGSSLDGGIYVYGANKLHLSTGNSKRLTIDGSGNVGIATTSPTSKLHSYSTAAYVETQGISSQSDSNIITLGAGSSGSAAFESNYMGVNESGLLSSKSMRFSIYGAGGSYFKWTNNGSEQMRITSGGNVGIGTTSPLSKLHIQGDDSSTTDETVLTLRGNGENGKRIDFRNAFGSLARITGTKLAGGASADEGILTFETATDSVLSEKMRITSGGNVGIGTSSPAEKLEVQNGTSGAKIKVSNTGGGYAMLECSSNATSTATLSFTNSISITGGNATFSNNVTATGFFNSSDNRLKDLTDYDYNVSDIKPITYLWKDGRDNKKHVGYSAQEVQKVMPDAVNEGTDGFLSVNYVEVLVAKIAELENRIKQLEK